MFRNPGILKPHKSILENNFSAGQNYQVLGDVVAGTSSI